MRILHTADLHLGRSLHGQSLLEDQAHVLDQLVSMARAECPDVLIVAGDIYDRAVPPADAVTLLDDVIARLTLDCKLPVILVPGNHDSPERLTFGARILSTCNLHIFSSFGPNNVVSLSDQHGPVDIYSVPFAEPPVARQELDCPEIMDHNSAIQEVVRRIRETRVAGRRSVLLAHGFVAGGEATESERPLVVGGAGAVEPAGLAGFDYVALGHLHRPQTAGHENIHYAGSILAYSFAEAGQVKSVNLVEIGAWGDCKVERLPLRPRHAVRCATGLFEDLKKGSAAGAAIDDYLMITLQDRGPVLDAMGQLRQIYPNLLHVQRAEPVISGEAAAVRLDHRRTSTDQLFSSFFRQVTGQDLTEAESAAFAEVYQQSQIEMREAA
ncbi:MAG: exonuclease SbcCD subunit D [Bryobacteraceae bacterium]|nr:exonuclease SbcCD subunit D [Bryobacteraceae bacterium]